MMLTDAEKLKEEQLIFIGNTIHISVQRSGFVDYLATVLAGSCGVVPELLLLPGVGAAHVVGQAEAAPHLLAADGAHQQLTCVRGGGGVAWPRTATNRVPVLVGVSIKGTAVLRIRIHRILMFWASRILIH
jgi:hypothetical protein